MGAMVFSPSAVAAAADITLYTENYGKYNHLDENGKVVGSTAALMRQVMTETGLDFDIKIVPWNRAYTLASQRDDALIYALLRKPDREHEFHWLVPVLSTDLFVYGRMDETRKIDMAMIKSGQLTGVCLLGDVACSMYSAFGMPEDMIVTITDDDHKAVSRVVVAGRADIFIAQNMDEHGHKNGRAATEPSFKKLLKLEQKQVFYLAAGKQVKTSTVDAVRAAYARLKSSGKLQEDPDEH